MLSGHVAGPLSCDELQFLKERGRLQPSDRVREGKEGRWVPAASLELLFPLAQQRRKACACMLVAPPGSPIIANLESHEPEREGMPARTRSAARPTLPKRTRHAQLWSIVGVVAGIAILALLVCLLFWFLQAGTGSHTGNKTLDVGRSAGTGLGDTAATASSTVRSGDSATQASKADTSRPSNRQPSDTSAPTSSVLESSKAINNSQPLGEEEQSEPPESALLSVGRTQGASSSEDLSGKDGASPVGGAARFFGIESKGRRIIYVVDRSASMAGMPLEKAKQELLASLERLDCQQGFVVMFYNESHWPMYAPGERVSGFVRPLDHVLRRVRQWIDTVSGQGGTNPRESLLKALALRPDVIFLLSDGEFSMQIADEVTRTNTTRVVINTIGFSSREGELVLKWIASENRGEYKFVP